MITDVRGRASEFDRECHKFRVLFGALGFFPEYARVITEIHLFLKSKYLPARGEERMNAVNDEIPACNLNRTEK